MLVLSRKVGESILVGDDVEVFVVSVSRGRVKLGFRASRSTAIRRAEIACADDSLAELPVMHDHELAPLGADVGHSQSSPMAPLRQFRILGAV